MTNKPTKGQLIKTLTDKIDKLSKKFKAQKIGEENFNNVTVKFPKIQKVDVVNQLSFPEELNVKVLNQKETPAIQAVKITNPVEVQKVKIENQPDVQKVKIENIEEIAGGEKNLGWLPKALAAVGVNLGNLWIKLWEQGVTVRLDATERLKPIPVIMVDEKGRVVRQQSGSVMIPMAPGRGSGATPPPSRIISGRKAVTTPGSALAIYSAQACRKVIITAPASNSDMVYLGANNVSAVAGSEMGVILSPTGSATLEIDDASKLYVDAVHAGDAITFNIFI